MREKKKKKNIRQTRIIVHFTCQHRTSWWSDGKFAMREGDLELTAEPFTTLSQQTSHANFVRIVTRMCCHTFFQSRLIDQHCTRAIIIVCYSQSVNQQGPSITYKPTHSSHAIWAVYNFIPSQCISRAELHKPLNE